MTKNVLSGIVLLLSMCVVGHSNADIILFDLQGNAGAGLLPGNENPGVGGAAGTGGEIGSGISFDNVSKILTINVGWGTGNGFTNLTGNATNAHVHQSTGFTVNGGVVFALTGAPFAYNNSASAGSVSGNSVALTALQESQLMANQFYINIHTATNPGGEIRGNLVAVPEPSSMAIISAGFLALGLVRRRKIQG